MNINELIKQAHDNAVLKGFYDCPECGGTKIIAHCYGGESYDTEDCPECNGTGIEQNKNIPELLMLVITEISESVEALRENRFADWKYFNSFQKDKHSEFTTNFEKWIKDTFEDEIADTFIRLFDICGYLEIKYAEPFYIRIPELHENDTENLFLITGMIYNLITCISDKDETAFQIYQILEYLKFFCKHNNIPIEKHINAKMEYNKSRPKKHGKEF